jgi:hypothetical protein
LERISIKMKNKNGQMRVIETILASFIIVFALSFANILAITPTSQKYEATELEKLGYNVLHDLDEQGLLARFVYTEEWDDIVAALRVTLPIDVYFNMTVYYLDDTNVTQVNHKPISYGYPETFVTSKNIASITYGLIGYPIGNNYTYQATYDPRIIILQLARG